MDDTSASRAFAALSQPIRLEILRLLAPAGRDGLTAGTVATRLGVVSSTLSHHLGQLERAGLVQARRQGLFMVYAIAPDGARRLIDYLARVWEGDRADRPAALGRPPAAARG